jgi:hypothetical protein
MGKLLGKRQMTKGKRKGEEEKKRKLEDSYSRDSSDKNRIMSYSDTSTYYFTN